ncbi:ankyrin repeats domain protein [Wolbachia endosymbiont of Armadillidium vulgare str. wVulC]|nr:ankyrin repeats domain protein [Wolbachia endosymbiont of Armadillidium vulgare str. wVulC]OJH31263.1 Ankyrin repeats (3 copies) [Wolbachia endosymbiont of Armadillidium vulgare]OJH32426.1 Ankyrin repeats (3 copies) [Wolbachia endosymbiont of Armadillidium vulgare]
MRAQEKCRLEAPENDHMKESCQKTIEFFNSQIDEILYKKLLTAIENGDLSEVRKFVSQGANVNAIEVGIFGKKPIHIAAEKNYKDIIEFLLGKGVSVDDTSIALLITVQKGHKKKESTA